MATTKILAPEHFEGVSVESTTDQWVQISGITSVSKTEDVETADVADWDGDGHGEQLVTQRSITYTLEGFKVIDPETSEPDEGQGLIEDAARKVGYDSRVKIKVDMIGDVYEEFTANVDLADQGGGVTDVSSWGVTLSAIAWPDRSDES